jgi:hypothetical protein
MNVFTEMAKSLSPSAYRVFRDDSGGKSFLYFLTLSLVGFILTIVVGLYLPLVAASGIVEKIPEFSMSQDGVLTADYTVDTTNSGRRFIVDTQHNYTYDENTSYVLQTDEGGVMHALFSVPRDEDEFFVIGRNALIVSNDNGINMIEYKDLESETKSKANKTYLLELFKRLTIPVGLVLFVLVALRLAIWNVVNAAMGACISSSMGVKNTFGQLYAMGFRAYTAVYLIKCILFAFHISLPFKTVLGLLITGLILSKGIKNVKAQLDTEADAFDDSESDYAYRLR